MWAPDYATVADLRAYTGIDDEASDSQLAGAITAASRTIDAHCGGRQFGNTVDAEVRTFTARDRSYHTGYQTIVDIDDLMTVVDLAVVVDGAAVTPARMWPQNAAAKGRPWTRLYLPGAISMEPAAIEVTGIWGWSAVPETIRQACLLQATRLFKRKDSPFGVAGSPDLGSELRLLAKVDPDVAVVLTDYVLRGRVA